MAGNYEGPFESWFDKCLASGAHAAAQPAATAAKTSLGLFRMQRLDGLAAGERVSSDDFRIFTDREAAAREAATLNLTYEFFDPASDTWKAA